MKAGTGDAPFAFDRLVCLLSQAVILRPDALVFKHILLKYAIKDVHLAAYKLRTTRLWALATQQ